MGFESPFSLEEGGRIGEGMGREEDVDPSAAAANGRSELAGGGRNVLETDAERVLDHGQEIRGCAGNVVAS